MTRRLGFLAAVILGVALLVGARPGRAEPIDALALLDAPLDY